MVRQQVRLGEHRRARLDENLRASHRRRFRHEVRISDSRFRVLSVFDDRHQVRLRALQSVHERANRCA